METVTLKLERRHIEMLKERARASGRSRAAIVRELIEQHLGKTLVQLPGEAVVGGLRTWVESAAVSAG